MVRRQNHLLVGLSRNRMGAVALRRPTLDARGCIPTWMQRRATPKGTKSMNELLSRYGPHEPGGGQDAMVNPWTAVEAIR